MKMPRRIGVGVVIACAGCLMAAQAREWTSTDGKTLDAEYVSSSDGNVTLKRTVDGQTFTVPLTRFTQADRDWVTEKMKEPAAPVTGPYADKLTGEWELAKHDSLEYAIYGAPDLDATKKYPLLISLHGRSKNEENGKQVNRWTKTYAEPDRYAKNPCIIMAPMGTQPWAGEGTAWNNEPGIQALDLIKDLIDELPVDEDRVYVFGHSMGGFGTCHFIISEPKIFAAGIASAGCSGSYSAGTFKRFPLWIFHAVDDPTVDVQSSRDMAEALKREKQFKYTEFPDGKHNIVPKIVENEEVHTWLFQQSRK